jgi:hypothetical protein
VLKQVRLSAGDRSAIAPANRKIGTPAPQAGPGGKRVGAAWARITAALADRQVC